MDEIARLIEELEDFKKTRSEFIELKELEKFMLNKLDAIRIDKIKGTGKKIKRGSEITYFHPLLKKYENTDGHFILHIDHKKNTRVRTINFKNILYQKLRKIIFYTAMERNKS